MDSDISSSGDEATHPESTDSISADPVPANVPDSVELPKTAVSDASQPRLEWFMGQPMQKRHKRRRAATRLNDGTRQTPLFPSSRVQVSMTQRKVVDLFACIGGFSTGASQSGHNIVLAVDCDETALAVHEANHPRTMHKLMFLGPDTEAELVALIRSLIPDDGTEWHIHGSPPCTKLSNARSMSRKRDPSILKMGQKEGLDLVEWYLDFVAKMNPTSWSMEQVDCKMVRDALEVRKRSNIRFLDYNVTNFVNYGVPQTRTRMIAGSPFLIHRLRFGNGMFEPVAKTIQDAIPNLPPEACYQRSNEHRKSDPSSTEEGADGTFLNEDAESRCRPLHQPSFTIMSHPMQWWDAAYRCVRNLNLCEVLALQTFPSGYKFPPGVLSVDQHKGVGNAVPPEFARRFMSVL